MVSRTECHSSLGWRILSTVGRQGSSMNVSSSAPAVLKPSAVLSESQAGVQPWESLSCICQPNNVLWMVKFQRIAPKDVPFVPFTGLSKTLRDQLLQWLLPCYPLQIEE